MQSHSIRLLQPHRCLPTTTGPHGHSGRMHGLVFLYGVGREGLMLKALCMRLAHLGLSTHFVFDMTTPPISSNDLLIASAGPGGFSTVDALFSLARSYGARVLLLTAQPETRTSAKHASVTCYVPAATMANDKDEGEGKSRALLPMGSAYEGALFVFEMVITIWVKFWDRALRPSALDIPISNDDM